MVLWFHRFRGVDGFIVSLVSWCQGFHGFIGFVVSRVSWFQRFRGVNGFVVLNPPRNPEFYTLTKIHKPSAVGRPIVSGCDGPTEKSSFVDKLLQPIA